MANLGGWELVILVGILVLLFGAKRLPDMARSIGQSARVFKGEMKGLKDEPKPTEAPPATPVQAPGALPQTQAAPAHVPPAQPVQLTQPQPEHSPAQPGHSTGQ